jgi:hypothetical protein
VPPEPAVVLLLSLILSPATLTLTLTSVLLAVDDQPWNHEFGIFKLHFRMSRFALHGWCTGRTLPYSSWCCWPTIVHAVSGVMESQNKLDTPTGTENLVVE